jgi:hypothetical protein
MPPFSRVGDGVVVRCDRVDRPKRSDLRESCDNGISGENIGKRVGRSQSEEKHPTKPRIYNVKRSRPIIKFDRGRNKRSA